MATTARCDPFEYPFYDYFISTLLRICIPLTRVCTKCSLSDGSQIAHSLLETLVYPHLSKPLV